MSSFEHAKLQIDREFVLEQNLLNSLDFALCNI